MAQTVHERIAERVLPFGGYKECLDTVVHLLKSKQSGSFVIRGGPGSGKATVINEASKMAGVSCVYINPFQCTNDTTACSKIARAFALDSRLHLATLTEKLLAKSQKQKLVFVLEDFPYFCRNKQTLLYFLLDLMHSKIKGKSGPNITLIGLTLDLTWIENIEKRVLSRLNALSLNLNYPYRDFEEYVQFTSQLLDNHKISKDSLLREQLAYMWTVNSRSIRFLKFYLMTICDLDKKGRLVVKFDSEQYKTDYHRNMNIFSKDRLMCLTKPQLNILKMAVYQYHDEDKREVSVSSLLDFNIRRKWFPIDAESGESQIFKDVSVLLTLGLICTQKSGVVIGQDSSFYPKLTPIEMKAVITMDPALTNIKTDSIWKKAK